MVIGYTVGVAAMLLAFWSTPASLAWLQWATVFMIGFFLYGPQMLIGLCGAELVGPESVGASEGFLGWVAYLGNCATMFCAVVIYLDLICSPVNPCFYRPRLMWCLVVMLGQTEDWLPEHEGRLLHNTFFFCCVGAANAGIPLSIIVKNYGWNAYFTALLAACGMAILLLAPMVNLKSYVQREGKAKTA